MDEKRLLGDLIGRSAVVKDGLAKHFAEVKLGIGALAFRDAAADLRGLIDIKAEAWALDPKAHLPNFKPPDLKLPAFDLPTFDLPTFHLPVDRTWDRIADHVERLGRVLEAFVAIMVRLRWPPPGHLPGSFCDALVEAYECGELTDDKVDDLFVQLHPPEAMGEFHGRWGGYAWLGKRTPIVRQALDCYSAGLHYAAVCTLVPQIEGVLRDRLGGEINYKRGDYEVMFPETRFGRAVRDFWLNVLREQGREAGYSGQIDKLGRHRVLHGYATDYGSAAHSLRIVLLADNIFGSLDNQFTNGGKNET